MTVPAPPPLFGRTGELEILAQLVANVRGGQSAVLVMRGEPGSARRHGPAAMLDALAHLKTARSMRVPVALEVSRSGVGAHAWVFFTGPVPAEMARRLGAGLLREVMALRGQMDVLVR